MNSLLESLNLLAKVCQQLEVDELALELIEIDSLRMLLWDVLLGLWVAQARLWAVPMLGPLSLCCSFCLGLIWLVLSN